MAGGRAPGGVAGRVAGGLAVACGAAVLVATFAAATFDRAEAGEDATDLVRSELEEEGLARHRSDFEATRAAVEQLYRELLPAFARDLEAEGIDLAYRLPRTYPAVAELAPAERRAETFAFAEAIVANLEEHREDFTEADAIPVDGLPMTVGPWVAVGFGATLVGLGLWLLARPGRAALVLLAVVGLAAVVGTFAVRYPQKAAAADDLLDTLNVTPTIAAETRAILETVGAAAEEMEAEVYPDVAEALGLAEAELDDRIEQEFPEVAAARARRDEVFDRYLRRVEIRESGLAVVPEAKRFPLEAVTWWAVVPGALVAIAAGAALALSAGDRRR